VAPSEDRSTSGEYDSARYATSTVLFHLQTDTDAHSVVDGTARRVNQTEERGRPGIRIHVGGGDP
jgi:hypothetical protein